MNDCLFCKINKGEIPSTKVYENEYVYAFNDIAPMASRHILIIPKVHVKDIEDLYDNQPEYLMHMINAAKEIAKQEGLSENGYRLVFNKGKDAGQTVFHVHMHMLGGEALGRFGV